MQPEPADPSVTPVEGEAPKPGEQPQEQAPDAVPDSAPAADSAVLAAPAGEGSGSSSDSDSDSAGEDAGGAGQAPSARSSDASDAEEVYPPVPVPAPAPAPEGGGGEPGAGEGGAEQDAEELPASPRGRRSSIVVAFAKGVGNALGLRQRSGVKGEEGEGEGAAPGEGGEEGAGADAPRRRRASLSSRPPPPPAGGDALPLEGAAFVSDAEGGDLQLSPRASGAAQPATAPGHGRSGSLTDLSIPEGQAGVSRAHSMPPPRRRKSILKDPSKPPSPMRGRRISFADEGQAELEQVLYCDNLHYSEGSVHEGDADGEKCVIS